MVNLYSIINVIVMYHETLQTEKEPFNNLTLKVEKSFQTTSNKGFIELNGNEGQMSLH